MDQDTRKDKRAKIVSLNVRYKSATVDEFIENQFRIHQESQTEWGTLRRIGAKA